VSVSPNVRVLPRLTDQGLRSLAQMVRAYSGICVGPDKHQLVENRLRRRVRELTLESIEAYAEYVRLDRSGSELENLIDLISTNHTAFFREAEHTAVLFERLAPTLRARECAGTPLRLWSAAAASGEEPYTIALMAAEERRVNPSWQWTITASDISRRMLDQARRANYPLSSVSVVPKELLRRYFERGVGTQEGRCRIKRELRDSVSFKRINLLDPSYPLREPQHVIFCRNVLIYFDEITRRTVAQRLLEHLVPGGYLVVGYSESLSGTLPGLRSVFHGVYTRS
jgi:chemotaxis protein methyltransferase CheR